MQQSNNKKGISVADKEKLTRHQLAGRKGGMAKTTKPKGLAALSPERRKEISRMGRIASLKKSIDISQSTENVEIKLNN